MQTTVRPSLRLVVREDAHTALPELLSARDIAERVLMFTVISLLWALVILAAIQASQ